MKLLLDQNLSHKLCAALADLYPGSSQVRLLGLDRADDLSVWRRAAAEGYVLVTHDTDFRNLSTVLGAPPKVVLLRCGNQPTAGIERVLRGNAIRLFMLREQEGADLLELG